MRALTAVWVRFKFAAAFTKLPLFTTSRNVRAILISISAVFLLLNNNNIHLPALTNGATIRSARAPPSRR